MREGIRYNPNKQAINEKYKCRCVGWVERDRLRVYYKQSKKIKNEKESIMYGYGDKQTQQTKHKYIHAYTHT